MAAQHTRSGAETFMANAVERRMAELMRDFDIPREKAAWVLGKVFRQNDMADEIYLRAYEIMGQSTIHKPSVLVIDLEEAAA